jgi:ribosomal protein uS17
MAEKSEEQNEQQIEETPAEPESVEETPVEAEAPAEEPEAVEETPAEPEAAAEEPEAAAEESPAEEPAAEEPAADEPVAEETAVEEPAAEEPAAEVPAAEEPAAEEPAAEEPAAEEPAAEEPAAEAPAAEAPAAVAEEEAPPAPQSEPKKKGKRLPRRLRSQKTRRRVAPSAERKPISREPKPEHERGRRQERRGIVVSSAMDKTIVVKVDVITSHQRYKKVIRRSVKFHAHDEQNAANVGDVVRIVETRPLSKTKRWRLAEVVEAAK